MFKERLAHVAQYSALPMKKNGDVEDKKCCGLMATRWNEVDRTPKRSEWWSVGERDWIVGIVLAKTGDFLRAGNWMAEGGVAQTLN